MSVATLNAPDASNLVRMPGISESSPMAPLGDSLIQNATSTPTYKSNAKAFSSTMDTPSSSTPGGTGSTSYRLLYRGALSLPDSYLVLDGLTFAARLDSPTKSSSSSAVFALLENPLALALESMRGRPTLHFMGIVNLKDVYLDESGGVELDIHPNSILTRIYFENTFCLLPYTSVPSSNLREQSEIGIKVALGDTDGPGMTEVVIFSEVIPTPTFPAPPTPSPSSSSHISEQSQMSKTIRLTVGRITARPSNTQQVKPKPRPDDLVPRKPPPHFLRELKRTESSTMVPTAIPAGPSNTLKRVPSVTMLNTTGPVAKKQKVAGVLADLGSGVRLGAFPEVDDVIFKVPDVPVKSMNARSSKPKGKEKEKEEDVFGDVAQLDGVMSSGTSGGSGVKAAKAPHELLADELEKANKNSIKRVTIDYLARIKDPTTNTFIDKSHPEFKEMYNFISRGTVFALRNKMRTSAVDHELMSRVVEKHGSLYVGGLGIPVSSSSNNATTKKGTLG